ncbi:MAG TPA: hypothetical protein PK586_04425 [Casimicrobium sp.]|nr:hypothetical protein [Casimicrobium sp.]
MFQRFHPTVAVLALLAAVFTPSLHAQTCPFDTGGSDAVNDGVVLTRYALGITGAPLTASTRYASLDPLQVKANIECVGCALDVNQDGVVDTIDTTVIARHLAGFSGAAVTNGLGLTPAVAASVTSFLANGCAVGGAINAFVHGGNTFALGAGVASVLGNNDNRPLTLKAPQSTIKLLVDPANGDDGLRISYATGTEGVAPNTINGSRVNSVAAGITGATVAGGGRPGEPNQVTGHYGTVGGGYLNVVGQNSVVAGGDKNQATGVRAVVSGGFDNIASGLNSTIPGGTENRAVGQFSFAAGLRAKANHDYAFVWGSEIFSDTTSTGPKQFVIQANGGIRLPGAGENQPGNPAKQSGTNMFTHVVPVAGPCRSDGPFGLSRTAIDHPLTNGKPDAILVVTPNIGTRSTSFASYGKPVNVMYDDDGGSMCSVPAVGRWMIVNPAGDQDMVPGMKFNVLVINP